MPYHRLTDSEMEARRALQCFLAYTGDPGYVYEEEEIVPGGPGTPDGQGGLLKTAIYQSGAREVRILLHKKEWDPKQQFGRRWWQAVRLQYWPNRDLHHKWAEFELKPVEFGGETPFGGWELRFKYDLVRVTASRPIEVTA